MPENTAPSDQGTAQPTTDASLSSSVNATPQVTATPQIVTQTEDLLANQKAERQKYAKLESDNARYTKEIQTREERIKSLEANERAVQAVERVLSSDPEAYEKFNAGFQRQFGRTLPPPGTQTYTPQITPAMPDLNQITYEVKSRMQFEDAITELATKQSLDLNSQDDIDKLKPVIDMAGLYVRNYGLDHKTAMQMAFDASPEVMQKRIDQAKATGEMIGKANKNSSNVGTVSPLTGASSGNAGGSYNLGNLNQKQLDKYNALKEKSERLANNYLKALN